MRKFVIRKLIRHSSFVIPGEAGWRGSLCRWNRARSVASPLRALLAQGVVRSRLPLQAGAVSAAGQSGNHPRRGQPENVKIARNIVNPDDVIDQYGADAFRCYEMFMGPLEQMKPWSMRGVEGVARFLARVWRLLMTENQAGAWELSGKVKNVEPDKGQQKMLHATIKKVTQDIESFSL